MATPKPLVFISCGQYSQEEKQLGKDICELVKTLRSDLDAYFAEYQSTVQGLSTHILSALHRCCAFICVMHPRGEIALPNDDKLVRGSVWIEQEVAILAFITEVLGKKVPIYFYKHRSVGREGIRSVLLTNARLEFVLEDEVRKDVEVLLPSMAVVPFAEYDVRYKVSFKPVEERADEHFYDLLIDIENCGKVKVEDFELRLAFPRKFLVDQSGAGTASHKRLCFRHSDWAAHGLYPGDRLSSPIKIRYRVNTKLFHSAAIDAEFTVQLLSGDMEPRESTYKIRDFLDF